ncbi:MAG: lysylphosphatidylglycerol synthase transmembrane domain-containing protein [Candidatus Omnitrophota bacterium]
MRLKERTKNFLMFFLRFGLSTVLLVYLFHKIDTQKMSETLKNADLRYIVLGALVFLVIHCFLLIRWLIFIKALNLKIPFSSIVRYFFIGLFFNLFLPTSTGGDVVKTLFLFKDTEHKAEAVATVVADRLFGFISIALVATVAFIFGHRLIDDNSILWLIGILAGACFMITLVLFNEKLYSFCCRIFRPFPSIEEKLMNFHYAIALLKGKHSTIVWTVGISCFTQLLLAVSFYFVAKAFGQHISFGYFPIFVPIICVISSLPSIGGLGVRDVGSAYLFTKTGMVASVAVSMSLMSFLYMVLIGLIGGVFYVIALSPRRVQCDQADSGMCPRKT